MLIKEINKPFEKKRFITYGHDHNKAFLLSCPITAGICIF